MTLARNPVCNARIRVPEVISHLGKKYCLISPPAVVTQYFTKLYNKKPKNTSRTLLWSIYAYLTTNVFNINFSLLRREKFSKVYFNVEKWSGQNIVWSGCSWFIGSQPYIDLYALLDMSQANNGCYHSYNTKSDNQEMVVVKLCFELKNLESTKVVQCWK